MIKLMKQVKIMLLLLMAFAACKEVFETPPQSLVEVAVAYSDGKQTGSPAISVQGVDRDSIWIYQVKTKQFRLPLSLYDSSSFVVLFDSIPDTLTIYHDTKLSYESMESGFFTEHFITGIKHSWNRIDSLMVVDSTVNQFWHENIRLYIANLPADSE